MNTDYSIIWDTALDTVRQEIGPTSFEIWFAPVIFEKFVDNHYIVSAPEVLIKEWIEARYLNILQQILSDLHRQAISVQILIRSEESPDGARPYLNPTYTFDTFVVGNSNRFAMPVMLCLKHRRSYNPLHQGGSVWVRLT